MQKVIEGIKLIRHTGGGVNEPNDPTYPFKLEAVLRPPEFMEVAFLFMFGNEEVVVRGITKEALEEFARANDLYHHPRLISLTIT